MWSTTGDENLSKQSKFFPFRVDPIEKGGNNENGRVISPGSVPFHLQKSQYKGRSFEFLYTYFESLSECVSFPPSFFILRILPKSVGLGLTFLGESAIIKAEYS